MQEEKLRILKLLEEGRLTADEAGRLLDALDGGGEKAGRGRKHLKVKVIKDDNEKAEVNVKLPMELLDVAARMVPRKQKEKLEASGVDLESIIEMVNCGVEGRLAEVRLDGKKVRIVVE